MVEFANPFACEGSWFRGALHVHSTGSDGRMSPAEVARHYRDLGYDFLAISDHRVISPLPEVDGILLLRAVELNTSAGATPGKSCHLVVIEPAGLPVEPVEDPTELLRVACELSKVVVLAHPYWSNLSGDDVLALADCTGVELYNTGCELEIGRGFSEYAWDYALSGGARLLGFAVDDSHQRIDDTGGAWVMVKAERLTPEALLASLEAGYFYSSMGPEFTELVVDETGVAVQTSEVTRIAFVANTAKGAVISSTNRRPITSARYAWRGGERYLRVQITDASGNRAWTNPVYPDLVS